MAFSASRYNLITQNIAIGSIELFPLAHFVSQLFALCVRFAFIFANTDHH